MISQYCILLARSRACARARFARNEREELPPECPRRPLCAPRPRDGAAAPAPRDEPTKIRIKPAAEQRGKFAVGGRSSFVRFALTHPTAAFRRNRRPRSRPAAIIPALRKYRHLARSSLASEEGASPIGTIPVDACVSGIRLRFAFFGFSLSLSLSPS